MTALFKRQLFERPRKKVDCSPVRKIGTRTTGSTLAIVMFGELTQDDHDLFVYFDLFYGEGYTLVTHGDRTIKMLMTNFIFPESTIGLLIDGVYEYMEELRKGNIVMIDRVEFYRKPYKWEKERNVQVEKLEELKAMTENVQFKYAPLTFGEPIKRKQSRQESDSEMSD